MPIITGKLDFPADHPMLEHFKFVAANTKVTPKISIPGPSADPFPRRRGRHPRRRSTSTTPRPTSPTSPQTYNKAVKAFYDAGCRYLQMDDIFFAYLCDPKIRADTQGARARIPTG